MGWVLLRVVLLVATTTSAAQAARQAKGRGGSHLAVRLLALDMCRDRPSALYNQTSVLRQTPDGSVSVDVSYYVTKTAQSFSKFEVVLVKCRDAVSSNSCEYFQTWSYSLGVCDVITAPRMPWSDAMSKVQPNFKCPFEKGLYQTLNATANGDAVKHLASLLEGNIWRVTTIFYNELKEVHLCWNTDMQFLRVKTG